MSRYGRAFVWHAATAAIAWTLAPAGFAWMRLQRRAGHSGGALVSSHRRVMLLVVILTAQTWAVAVYNAKKTPPSHLVLGSLVALLAMTQGAFGVLRPPVDAGYHRHLWAGAHRAIAAMSIAVAAYTLHHSVNVFQLPAPWSIAIRAALGGALGFLAAVELVPSSVLARVVGRREGFFEHGDEESQKIGNEVGAAVDFRVVEDRVVEEEVLVHEVLVHASVGGDGGRALT